MLTTINTSGSAKLPFEQHALLLYSPDDDTSPTKYVNEALRRGQLVVYVPVSTSDNVSDISEITPEITNYEDNVNRGNLLTIDIRSFYNLVLAGNMQPFEELKILLEEAIRERIASGKNDEITLVSGIGGTLSANLKFDQSIKSEKWWQKTHDEWLKNGLKVTMICAHPSNILDKNQFMQYKQTISSLHHITLSCI